MERLLRIFPVLFVLLIPQAKASDATVAWVWLVPPPEWLEPRKLRGESQARADIAKGLLKIKSIGLPVDSYNQHQALLQKYHLIDENLGCISPEQGEMAEVDAYNKVMNEEIERRYGEHFWLRFALELAAARDKAEKAQRPPAEL